MLRPNSRPHKGTPTFLRSRRHFCARENVKDRMRGRRSHNWESIRLRYPLRPRARLGMRREHRMTPTAQFREFAQRACCTVSLDLVLFEEGEPVVVGFSFLALRVLRIEHRLGEATQLRCRERADGAVAAGCSGFAC